MSIFDPPEEQFVRKMENTLEELEYLDIVGLDEVIFEIRNLKTDNGYYKRIAEVSKVKRKYASGAKFTREEGQQIKNLMMGFHNIGGRKGLYLHPFTDLIDFSHFETLYSFLEILYYSNNNKKIERQDALNIYFSGLDQRIIFYLECFNEVKETPELTPEFFQNLKKMNWQDKESKYLYKRLGDAMMYVGEAIFDSGFFGGRPREFMGAEMFFTLFLGACSAISDNRLEINKYDVVCAYKTYFKLLKTDITVYKADPDLARESGFEISSDNSHEVYLVCSECGAYYQIPEGESPDDYSDTCECGVKLEYLESLPESK